MATETIVWIDLSEVVRDPEIQDRAVLNIETVTQYAEDMLAGIEFPPVVVYYDGEKHWLSQGFHRCAAAEQAAIEMIAAEVRTGTRKDAIWDSAGSNVQHDRSGMRRTESDKERAAEIALSVYPELSNVKIAEHVGVNERTVRRARQNLGIADLNGQTVQRFNQTNEQVDWARWTWNPVTGCEHNCIYCYARDIANRFYPEKFVPTFHEKRLNAPRNTKLPDAAKRRPDRNVFVCSMADLFGRWVPDEWIEKVFDSCRQSPEWDYLFLTKFPNRYVNLEFPETAWIGTSVDEQKRVANAEKAFSQFDAKVKWLSVEPMREPIVFNDLSMFHWVVIGGQSRSSGDIERHPEWEWAFDLAVQAKRAGCKVYFKPNTFSKWEVPIKEFPLD
jgi:protein gp37